MKRRKRILSFLLSFAMLMTLFSGISQVSAADVFPQEGSMVVNGGFETDADSDGKPDSWILNDPDGRNPNMSQERTAGKVYAGEASLKFTAPANANDNKVTVTEEEYHRVNPASTYIIEFYARVPSGVIHLFVNEKTAPDSEMVRKDMAVDAHQWAHASTWTKFTKEYTPTPGMEYARLEFHNWNPIALEGYIDNVNFKEKLEPIQLRLDQNDSNVVDSIDDMEFVISGTVTAAIDLQELQVNGKGIPVESDGSFSTSVILNKGSNPIAIIARDMNNNEISRTIFVELRLPQTVKPEDVIAADREDMIVYPHFGTPAFVEPGQTLTAEVAAKGVTTSGWSAYVENDLRQWGCAVGEVEYGENNIYLGMRAGYTIPITIPAGVSPELCTLVLTHADSGKTYRSPMSLSIVPELDTSFYTLGVTDTHFYWTDHGSNAKEGGNDGKSMGLVAKAATLAGVRFLSHTGDISLSGEVSRAVGIQDYLMNPILKMGRTPFILAAGNHEYDAYVYPIPSTTEGTRTGDFAFNDFDRYFGMRSQVMDMGSFAVAKHDFSAYTGDRDLRAAMTSKWNSVFGDGTPYTYRLLLQHTYNEMTALFYMGNDATPISPYPSLQLKGHDHQLRVNQSEPFLVLSQGGWEPYKNGQGVLYNFNLDGQEWSCPQANTSFGVNSKVSMVEDARKGYDIAYLRENYSKPNNGTASDNTCTITNDINFNFYDGRVRFEMAKGNYDVAGGIILSQYDYQDDRGEHTAVLVDVDIAPNSVTRVSIIPRQVNPPEPGQNQPYDVGMFYFSNWNPELSPHMIVNTQKTFGRDNDWFGGIKDTLLVPGLWGHGPIADREPLLGWYDDRQQEILDNHILQAASRGIDHFAFYYYMEWDGKNPRGGQNVELWKTSPYRNLMDYYIYYVADGAYSSSEWRNNIVPKLVEFMKEPYYKKSKSSDPEMDGRPILGFFADMKSRLGGTNASLKTELDYLRTKAIEAGLKNPILLYDGYRTLDTFVAQGYDGFLPLCLAGIGLDDNIGVPEDYASAYPDAWNEFVYADYSNQPGYQNYENYLFIPGGLNAYDVRPWTGVANPSGHYMYADPSPGKFKAQLNNVKDYLDTHPRSMKMATFYAWNEWGEGGSIEPNTLFGYGYVDAIQEVFGLNNQAYKKAVQDNELADIAPDVRIDVEPEWSTVTEGQEVVLKTRVKNYSNTQAAGTLTLSQPAQNADGKDQPLWTVKSAPSMSFNLAPNAAMDLEFVVDAGEGDEWTRHNFILSDGTQEISTFVVKAAPFYSLLAKDESKTYHESKFDIILTTRNYTMDEKTVNYTLKLPRRWTADKPTGTVNLAGYSGTGVHENRTVKDRVVISCPADTEPGYYTIKLVTGDGEFSKEESFTLYIAELMYHGGMIVNGDFEADADHDGKPDGWILLNPNNVAAAISLETNPGVAYNGSGASLKLTSPVDTNDSVVYATQEQFSAVDPEKTYVIDFYAKVPASGVIHLFVEEKASADGEGVLKDMEVDAHQWAHQNWTKFTKEYMPSPGMHYARVAFYNWNPNPLTGYIDNVSFKIKTGSTGYAPVIILDQEDITVANKNFTVSGTVYDDNGDLTEITVNGTAVAVDENDRFSKMITLDRGENIIYIVAKDAAGNETEKSIKVTLEQDEETPRYDIGAFYFSNWNPTFSVGRIENAKRIFGADSDWFGGIRETLLDPNFWGHGPIADREPLLGWYNDMQQQTLDSHILQAASRGIDHFSFYYYWNWDGSGPRPGQNIEMWKTSPYRDLMDYYIYYVADGAYNASHWRNNIVPKLVEFMKEPYYKKSRSDDPEMDGRPIMGFFADMKSRMGGTNAKLKTELDYLRTKAMEAGLKNPILLYDGYRTLEDFMEQGYDGFLPLCLAGIGLDDNIGVPEDYASAYPSAWNEFVYADYSEYNEGKDKLEKYYNYEDYLMIPGGLNAYDVRPWTGVGNPDGKYFYADPSPLKFKEQLNNVKDYLDTQPGSMNMATFYAWNEWGEGGSIEPNTLFGYGYIDAMQEVFGLDNADYKRAVQDNGIADIAPDVRIDAEPEWSTVTEGQEVVLKTRIKNYSTEQAAGILTLSQPAKNAEGIDQPLWTVQSSSNAAFDLAPGEAADVQFVVTVGEGDVWTRHNFVISDGTQEVSTFVVKAAPFHAMLEKDENKAYSESKFDLLLTMRNHTLEEKTVSYTIELPQGWTADKPVGTVNMWGYSGTGVHENRTVKESVVVSCPVDTQIGDYSIKLITSDGVFSEEKSFKIRISELMYNSGMVINGDFEAEADEDGLPDGWILVTPENVAATMSLETNPGMVYTGSASLKFTSPAGTNNSGVYIKEELFHEVIPGGEYVMDFYARVPSSGVIHLFVEEKASENSEAVLKDMAVDVHQWAHQKWTKFTVEYTPAANVKYARIAFRNWNPNPLEGYIDNVSFRLKSAPAKHAPVITLDQEDATVESASFTVSGLVQDEDGDLAEVTVNGTAVTVDENDRFSTTVTLAEGENTIEVIAVDAAGNETVETITVTYNAPVSSGTAPVITLEQEDATVESASFTVSGLVQDEDEDLAEVTVNGTAVTVDENGRFSTTVTLAEGENTIEVIAIDAAGNETVKAIKVTYNKPYIPSPPVEITYTVNFETNGGNAVASQKVSLNASVASPANPVKEGFVFDGWFTDKELTKKYDFSGKVTRDITLYAKWSKADEASAQPSPWQNKFTDVKASDWFYDDVAFVVENGLFEGLNETNFGPGKTMTRGMMVTVLYKLAGKPDASGLINQFSDVDEDEYYADAVKWAQENGIIAGVGGGLFAPGKELTRQQAAVILMKYLNHAGVEYTVTEEYRIFPDEDEIADYAKNAVQVMNQLGVINGRGNNVIAPTSSATRAEIAAMLRNFMAVLEDFENK